jgi:hypothetical protein
MSEQQESDSSQQVNNPHTKIANNALLQRIYVGVWIIMLFKPKAGEVVFGRA